MGRQCLYCQTNTTLGGPMCRRSGTMAHGADIPCTTSIYNACCCVALTLDPKPHTPHPKPHTPHPKPHTPHPKPHTPHPKTHTPHPEPSILHSPAPPPWCGAPAAAARWCPSGAAHTQTPPSPDRTHPLQQGTSSRGQRAGSKQQAIASRAQGAGLKVLQWSVTWGCTSLNPPNTQQEHVVRVIMYWVT
jgi:hypothetical protein